MIDDNVILGFQFIAAIFMGVDYFLDEPRRKKLNNFIKEKLANFDKNLDAKAERTLKDMPTHIGILFLGSALFIFGIQTAELHFELAIRSGSKFIATLLSTLTIAEVIAGSFIIARSVSEGIIPAIGLALAGLVWKFFLECPKGSIFAVGYISLMISFACRWLNLH